MVELKLLLSTVCCTCKTCTALNSPCQVSNFYVGEQSSEALANHHLFIFHKLALTETTLLWQHRHGNLNLKKKKIIIKKQVKGRSRVAIQKWYLWLSKLHTHSYNSHLVAVELLGIAIDLLTAHLNWVSAYSWAVEPLLLSSGDLWVMVEQSTDEPLLLVITLSYTSVLQTCEVLGLSWLPWELW